DDPEWQERHLEKFWQFWGEHQRGETTEEEFYRKMAIQMNPDDPDVQERMVSILLSMDETGMGDAIATAIRLPGVAIPVGKPGQNYPQREEDNLGYKLNSPPATSGQPDRYPAIVDAAAGIRGKCGKRSFPDEPSARGYMQAVVSLTGAGLMMDNRRP